MQFHVQDMTCGSCVRHINEAIGKVDPAAVAPYLGQYENARLGVAKLSLRGDRLVLEANELGSELRPIADAKTVYLLHDPPLSLFSEAYGATVTFTLDSGGPRMNLSVPGSITGPEEEFVFRSRR